MAARLSLGECLARAEEGRELGRPTAWLRPPIVICLGLARRAASATLHRHNTALVVNILVCNVQQCHASSYKSACARLAKHVVQLAQLGQCVSKLPRTAV